MQAAEAKILATLDPVAAMAEGDASADAATLADFLASTVDVFTRMTPKERAARINVLLEALAARAPEPFTVRGGGKPHTIRLFEDEVCAYGNDESDEPPDGDWFGASEDALPLVSNVKVDVTYDFSMTISSKRFWEWPKGRYFYSDPVWRTDACARCRQRTGAGLCESSAAPLP